MPTTPTPNPDDPNPDPDHTPTPTPFTRHHANPARADDDPHAHSDSIPPSSFAPPRINVATEIRKHGRTKAIELIFEPTDPATLFPSDPLNVADATNVSSYQLLALVRAKRSRAIVVQPVPLASATYSHVTLPASATYGPFEEVTLTLSQPIPQSERLQFTAFSSTSAIVGVHGIAAGRRWEWASPAATTSRISADRLSRKAGLEPLKGVEQGPRYC